MAASSPNLVVVLCDQLRRSALGCYGDKHGATPNIDKLAERGATYEKAYSTYPICVPFRFTLMTGHYAHSRQVPGISWRMSPAERTLADEFNEGGYDTAYVGKWHLYGGLGPAMFKKAVPREFQGRWQKWRGFEFRNDFFDSCYFVDDDPTPREIDGYQTDGLFDAAIKYINDERDRSKPFCCVVSVEAPHPPFEAPKEYEEKWLARDITPPDNFMVPEEDELVPPQVPADRKEDMERVFRIYYAMLNNLDDNVGRMVKTLDDAGLSENTIVMFISDHGEFLGSHCRRNKQLPHEESAGIPLVVAGPGIEAGRRIASPVATEDLFPTLLGFAGLPQRDDLFGVDASPLARGEADSLDRPGVMLEFVEELRQAMPLHGMPYRGFVSGRYKYTVIGGKAQHGMQPWHFFDLETDPCELNNLIDDPDSQPLIKQHHQWLYERMKETGDHAWLAANYGMPTLNDWVTLSARG